MSNPKINLIAIAIIFSLIIVFIKMMKTAEKPYYYFHQDDENSRKTLWITHSQVMTTFS